MTNRAAWIAGLVLALLLAAGPRTPALGPVAEPESPEAVPTAGAPAPDASWTLRQRAAEEAARAEMARPLNPPRPAPVRDEPSRASAPRRGPGFPAAIHMSVGIIVAALLAWLVLRLSRSAPAAPAAPAAAPHIRAAFSGAAGAGPAAGLSAPAPTHRAVSNPRFWELALARQVITPAEQAVLNAQFGGDDLAAMLYLAEQRAALKETIGKLWGDSMQMAYVDPTRSIIQYALLDKLPRDFAGQHRLIPLYALNEVVTVAMADPLDQTVLDRLEGYLGAIPSTVFAFPDHILAALEIARLSAQALHELVPGEQAGAGREHAALERHAEEQSMAEFARGLFLLALKQSASDVHIEPTEGGVVIRLRIDGALQPCLRLPMSLFPSLSNVVKILAGADIGDRRRPQDGRITLALPDRALEFRFSSIPTIYGEKLVMRLLGQNQFSAVPSLDDLNFSTSILAGIRRIIEAPNGVFFVTGPTGSGKTTTLYAALKDLNRKDVNIVTIEDPVEYRLAGINQVQVNPQAGVTFASALRAFLRQDPDVILVGEIRDAETAKIAAQAALTGHLVLTTMHTNNALQAITRLIQIGVEPFLVAPSIIGVMAQRLVRRLCDHCKESVALTPAETGDLFTGWDGREPVTCWRAKGCEQCGFIGYRGRLAIHELFVIDDEIRDFIAHNATILDIRKYAREQGFTTMSYDGIKKALRGLTTLDEIRQATAFND